MAMQLHNVNKLSRFKEYENDLDFSHNKLQSKSIVSLPQSKHIIVNTTSLANNYIYHLRQNCLDIVLTDEEIEKYRYQPKKFCHDRWDDTELWSLLLKINNMPSYIDFNLKKIKIFSERTFDTINELLILEQGNIDRNVGGIKERLDRIEQEKLNPYRDY